MIRAETFADAEIATTSAAVAATASASGSRLGTDENAIRMKTLLSLLELDCSNQPVP